MFVIDIQGIIQLTQVEIKSSGTTHLHRQVGLMSVKVEKEKGHRNPFFLHARSPANLRILSIANSTIGLDLAHLRSAPVAYRTIRLYFADLCIISVSNCSVRTDLSDLCIATIAYRPIRRNSPNLSTITLSYLLRTKGSQAEE